MRGYPMPGANGFGILFGIAGFVGTLIVIAIIVALVIYLARRNKQPQPMPGHPGTPPSAMHLLDERLARGDIEIDDYLNRKSALLGQIPQSPEPPGPPAPADPQATNS